MALNSSPTRTFGVGGLLVAAIGHAVVGFLAISAGGGRDNSGRLATVFCAVAAILGTAIQIGLTSVLVPALQIQLGPSDATWLIVAAAIGQLWILALASRRFYEGSRSRDGERQTTLNPEPSAAPTHS